MLDRVCSDQEVVFVRRRNHRDVALIPAEELSSLMETAHLLRSGPNAIRLVSALPETRSGELKPCSVPALRREFGVEKD